MLTALTPDNFFSSKITKERCRNSQVKYLKWVVLEVAYLAGTMSKTLTEYKNFLLNARFLRIYVFTFAHFRNGSALVRLISPTSTNY